jgi:hypothetical protein
MGVTVTNLISGPGTMYTGAFGATEPADSAVGSTPVASTWTDVGGTSGGVKLTINMEYAELEVDQVIDVPERRATKRDVYVETKLAEPTLANLVLALNGGTVTASSAYSTYDPDDTTAATQPTYKALIFDGYAPRTVAGATMRRRVVVRKTLNTADVVNEAQKKGQVLTPVKFNSHWVSSSIKPFRVIDQLS